MKIENCLKNLSTDKIQNNLEWYQELKEVYERFNNIKSSAEKILLNKNPNELTQEERETINEFLLLLWGDRKGFGDIKLMTLTDKEILGKYFNLLYDLTRDLLDVNEENFVQKWKEISKNLKENKTKIDSKQIAYKALTIRAISILMDLKLNSLYTKFVFNDFNKCLDKPFKKYPHDLIKISETLNNYLDLVKPIFSTEFKEVNDKLIKHILPWIITENCCNYEKIICFKNSNLKIEPFIKSSFYNSLKTKGFVILAGLSGTGKTKIFEEFVKCFPPLNKSKKEKWIVIKETGEKLFPVKKEEIEFNRGKITIKDFIDSLNKTIQEKTNRKVKLKIKNYYTEIVPIIDNLRNKMDFIGAGEVSNYWATYMAVLFKFEIIEKDDIKKLNLKKLDKELEIKEFERKMSNNLFFSIRPDFKDTKSLLGFYNPLKEQYHSTPLLNFVLNAANNYLEKGNEADPFFVLFDEMNLARVEYYFADFLSILEAKRFENSNELLENEKFIEFLENLGKEPDENNYKFTSQSIKLHNEENIDDIPKELFLPPNLYFVGTVNIDETTHMFSPKVLDRAFTIEFDVGSFKNYVDFLEERFLNKFNQETKNSISEDMKNQLKQDFINNGDFAIIYKNKIEIIFALYKNKTNKEQLNNLISQEEINNISKFIEELKQQEVIDKLEKINKTLKKYNLDFGYRVFDEIIMFLYNSENSQYKFENLNEAFDLAIKMKVLPKFHGTRQRLEEPIIEFLRILELKGEWSDESNENQEKNIIKEISENLKGIPVIDGKFLKVYLGEKELHIETPYLHTTHKLLEMLYKLQTQGFASFM